MIDCRGVPGAESGKQLDVLFCAIGLASFLAWSGREAIAIVLLLLGIAFCAAKRRVAQRKEAS